MKIIFKIYANVDKCFPLLTAGVKFHLLGKQMFRNHYALSVMRTLHF